MHLLIRYQRAVDQGLTMNYTVIIFRAQAQQQHISFFQQLEQLTGKVKTQEIWRCGTKKTHKAEGTTHHNITQQKYESQLRSRCMMSFENVMYNICSMHTWISTP